LTFIALHGGNIKINSIGKQSIQGDISFCSFLTKLGYSVVLEDTYILFDNSTSVLNTSKNSTGTSEVNFVENVSLCTDSFLCLGVILSQFNGSHTLSGLSNQAVKECNRLETFAINLNKIGIMCIVFDDGIKIDSTINRLNNYNTIKIISENDHRMVMSFAILGSYIKNKTISIDNKDCVNKTYPEFWLDFNKTFGLSFRTSEFIYNKSIYNLQTENYLNSPIIIIGMRSCGKSVLSKLCADKLKWDFIDLVLILLIYFLIY